MDVITLYGRKASALRAVADDSFDYSESELVNSKKKISAVNPFKEPQKKSKSVAASIPFYGFGINGYSPKKNEQKSIEKDFLKKSLNTRSKSFPSESLDRYRLFLVLFSALIFAVVPYTVFNFFNDKIDTGDWAKYILDSTINSEVPSEITETDAVTGELVTRKILTLDELFDSKLVDAEERFALSMNQNEAQFDNDGNLILEDGISIPSDSIVLGEPVSYSTYTVKSGDTIESITYKFGLRSISTLIATNEIKNVRTLRAGQKLTIPSQDGLVHKVSLGESLNSLSVRYHISVEDILDTNDMTSDILSVGQKIFMPGAKLDNESLRDAMGETFKCPITARWRLTSHFGTRTDPISGVLSSHTGIDMACPTGTQIKAAMSGTVLKAGWSNIYGNYVILKHPNGYQSLYGHMTKYVVRAGQFVDQGTKIGYVGSTGYSTGPHLHLTIYKNGKRVDPLPLIKK